MENQSPLNQKGQIRYYFVLLLDIPAQKEQLRKWQQLRGDSSITPEMREGIQNSLGRVLRLRSDCVRFFKSFGSGGGRGQYHQLILDRLRTDAERRRYEALTACVPRLLHFSDLVVAYSPATVGPSDDWNVWALFSMLASLCVVMPAWLAQGIPVRGGICIGVGTEADTVGFYGPALAEAHYLESEVAGYPRAVVSAGLRDFIRFRPPERGGPADGFVRTGFKLCRSMIADDPDGNTVVDYLGVGSHALLAGDGNLAQARQQAVDGASKFVAEECQRFALASESAPSESAGKLAERYRRLKNYFGSRPSVWTDSTAGGTPGGNGAA